MRGSIRQRYKGSWSLIIDLGYQPDPKTGKLKRKQRWMTVRGTKRDAEAKLAEVLHQKHQGRFVEPSKLTLGEWLDEWLDTAIKPPHRRWGTYQTYRHIIGTHLKPALGHVRLQYLRATDLQRYYAAQSATLAGSTLSNHQVILHSALQEAQRQDLVPRNVAALVMGKPRRRMRHEMAQQNCWTVEEARRFLAVAKAAGPQVAAFYALALETGMRKGELCGLRWQDVDVERGQLTVAQQLMKASVPPLFGPPKTGTPRMMTLGRDAVALLRIHKAQQTALKLANRQYYHDYDLVFAKDWTQMQRHHDTLGDPLSLTHLADREFDRLIQQAGVRRITFHGLRHTCATLMMQAGVPIKVIQERLGHKQIEITLGIYAHVLPSMQQEAATKLTSLLHA